ncbi:MULTISPECIES: YciI family protein [unclassified Luteococcus]|uniref:YciI family protein n=1 Tax=unclassified Luteococcus TaxID=2639923 RepID=UPI00313E359C
MSKTYLLQYTYGDGDRMVVLEEHKAYMRELVERRVNVVAGAYGPDETPGAVFVLRAGSPDEVAALSDADPFHSGGFVAERWITEFIPMSGELVEQVKG